MKVKATDNFDYYRYIALKHYGLTVEQFRALQRGDIVDIDKKLYDENKSIFEVVKTSKKDLPKEVKHGN